MKFHDPVVETEGEKLKLFVEAVGLLYSNETDVPKCLIEKEPSFEDVPISNEKAVKVETDKSTQ